MNKIKVLFLILAVALVSPALLFGAKFISAARNIYKFENPTPADLAAQFKKLVLQDEVALKTDAGNRTNILLLGIAGPDSGNGGENLTDTIAVFSVSSDKKRIAVNSIPRDLYLQSVDGQIAGRINSIYAAYEKNDPKEGIRRLQNEIKNITGFETNYYLMLDFEGFKKIIDQVGGIDYTLEEDIYDPAFPNSSFGYEPLYLRAGNYHLDGETALKIARSRHTIKGDFSRIGRQHELIKLLKEKLQEKNIWGNFFVVNNILNLLRKNIKTDITLPEILELSKIARNIGSDNIISRIPSDEPGTGLLLEAKINEADVLLPKEPGFEELRKFYQE